MSGPAETIALIAVVDDDVSVLASLKSLLSSAGYQVALFSSAKSFLESGRLSEVGCLILDLQMPEMTGQELLTLLSSQHPMPVIIVTANMDDFDRDKLLRGGAVAFFTKPFRASDILEAIRKTLTTRSPG